MLKPLLLQICLILILSSLLAWVLRKFRQPRVIGEIIAGMMLGPSLFRWIAPGLSAQVFPPESLGLLYGLSQIGLLLFAFMLGLKIDTAEIRRLGRRVVIISNTSVIAPFVLGVAVAIFLYPKVAEPTVPYLGFVLFMGTAMSVTALPVLARILKEQGLLETRLGSVSLACAAVDDVTAWCLLAVILTVVNSTLNALTLWQMALGLCVYLTLMLAVLRPALRKVVDKLGADKVTDKTDRVAVVVDDRLGAGY